MTCHLGGFPTLQPLTGETLTARSTNTDDNAQLDIHARGFWKGSQDVFFSDVRVFYSILTHPAFVPLIPTGDMSRPRSENTVKGSKKWSVEFSHP